MDVPERGSGGDRDGLERASEAVDRGETVLERASAAKETVLNEAGWPVPMLPSERCDSSRGRGCDCDCCC